MTPDVDQGRGPPVRRLHVRRSPLVRAASFVVLLPAMVGVACVGWATYLRLGHNIHEIEPGVFRSGQLPAADLAALIRDHGIRTVLNLRGPNPGRPWYEEERAVARGAGVDLIDVPMSANHEPDPATLRRLVAELGAVRPPFLLHCEAGADRSGLASAIYERLVAHRSIDVAKRQLSFTFGHFPWLLSRTGAMDRAFDAVLATPGDAAGRRAVWDRR